MGPHRAGPEAVRPSTMAAGGAWQGGLCGLEVGKQVDPEKRKNTDMWAKGGSCVEEIVGVYLGYLFYPGMFHTVKMVYSLYQSVFTI